MRSTAADRQTLPSGKFKLRNSTSRINGLSKYTGLSWNLSGMQDHLRSTAELRFLTKEKLLLGTAWKCKQVSRKKALKYLESMVTEVTLYCTACLCSPQVLWYFCGLVAGVCRQELGSPGCWPAQLQYPSHPIPTSHWRHPCYPVHTAARTTLAAPPWGQEAKSTKHTPQRTHAMVWVMF